MRSHSLPIADSSSFVRPIRELINLADSRKAELEALLQRRDASVAFSRLESEFVNAADGYFDGEDTSRVVIALREVKRLADEKKNLTTDSLIRINQLLCGYETQWKNARAETAIRLACHWFEADSFAELHPLEQAATVYLRLYEIEGFEQLNRLTSLLAASLFTMRAGFPPIMIPEGMDEVHRTALIEAARMNTRPMVELMISAEISALTYLIQYLEDPSV